MSPTHKTNKAAKKFGQQHKRGLRGIIKQRKFTQIVKARKQGQRKGRQLGDADLSSGSSSDDEHQHIHHSTVAADNDDIDSAPLAEDVDVDELDVDQLLDGQFDTTTKLSDASDDDNEASADDVSENELPPQKRRGYGTTTNNSSASELEDEEAEEAEEAEDSGSGEDSELDSDIDVEAEASKLQAEIEAHQQQLQALKHSDPAFYSHLEKENTNLLKFQPSAPSQDDEQLDDDAEADEDAAGDQPHTVTLKELTTEEWNAIKSTVSTSDKATAVKACKHLARIFRSAAHLHDERLNVVDKQQRKGKKGRNDDGEKPDRRTHRHNLDLQSVQITNSKLYDDIIRYTFKHFPTILNQLLPNNVKPSQSLIIEQGYGANMTVIKSLLTNAVHFLHCISTLNVGNVLIRFVLSYLRPIALYFAPFRRLITQLLKLLLPIWATSDHNTRIDAFLCIHTFCVNGPLINNGMVNFTLELTLKQMYLTYVQYTKSAPNRFTQPIITFMVNCLIEVYSLDMVSSYQHAFVYIRQLAITLRTAAQASQVKDAHHGVYNWSVVNCIRAWCGILGRLAPATAGSDDQKSTNTLRPLLYPLIQISLSIINLLPSARYLPLRLVMSQMLIQLASTTGIYIPLAPYLLTLFDTAELKKKPGKPSSKSQSNAKESGSRKVPEISYTLKVGSTIQSNPYYQEKVVQHTLQVLQFYYTTYSYSIAYPELILPTVLYLRRFVKHTQNVKIKKSVHTLVQRLEANSLWVEQYRNNPQVVNYSPRQMIEQGTDVIQTFKSVGKLSPLAQLASQLKQEDSEEVNEKAADWTGKTSQKKGKRSHDDSDDDSEADDDVDDEPATRKAKKPAKQLKPQPAKRATFTLSENAGDADAEDVVEEMTLSDVE